MSRLLETEAVDLPDIITLTQRDIDDNFQLWVYWQALDRRFLPSEIEKQSYRKLSTLLYLDNIFGITKVQDAEDSDG